MLLRPLQAKSLQQAINEVSRQFQSRCKQEHEITDLKTETKVTVSKGWLMTWKCRSKVMRGNILWSLWDVSVYTRSRTLFATTRTIRCDVLDKLDEGWQSRRYYEAHDPMYHSCPLSFLNEAPLVKAQWREYVLEYHRVQAIHRNLKLGCRVQMKAGLEVEFLEVTRLNPLCGRSITDFQPGQEFKIPKDRILRVLAEEEQIR